MLPPALISARLHKELVVPSFLRPANALQLLTAQQLLALYRDAAQRRMSTSEIDAIVTPIVNGAADRRFAMAIRKLLEDRCTFTGAIERNYTTMREQVFRASAAMLKGDAPLTTLAEMRRILKTQLPENELLKENQLYGDLPYYDCLAKFDDLNEQQLLERYDIALVQGLLLSANNITVTVRTREIPRLRRLFKYLRFFQLMCTIDGDDDKALRKNRKAHDDNEQLPEPNPLYEMKMTIDGPASILEQSRRYGLQLAIFFPAICTMDEWELVAKVEWKDRPAILKLDQTSALKCPYQNFAAYLPDEIKLFSQHFQDTVTDWHIVTDVPFLRGSGREIIVPDFSFENNRHCVIHLELFNRWHSNGLGERLAWLEKHPKTPLLLGVDKSITRKPELNELLENSPWFAQHGFTYRDYPTCEKVRRLLNKI